MTYIEAIRLPMFYTIAPSSDYWKQLEKQARNESFKVHEMEQLY
jgi:hypothetical protein